ncbi:MAG: ribonuclease J [Acidimicrobiales bacterium]|nr:ribonuclease J [Acidimicrobiales bacterium]
MAQPVRVVFLGGLGEIGRNCAAIDIDGRIMLIDCGLMFPDNDMAGIDLVLPDFTWLRENAHRVDGVVATHGHEDHIGAIGWLLDEMPLKVIGSPLTIGLAKNRIEERGHLKKASFIEVSDGDRIQVGPFDMEFFPVTHSVPHGYATAFHTPQGVILHSGDFKLDMTPVDGRLTDLAGIGHLATDDGIRLFLCDSTNAQSEGFSDSETSIGQNLEDVVRARAGRRLIVACFASHIHRVQQIANAVIAEGRTVVTMGRSMNKNVALARQMGLLDIPDNKLAKIEDVDRFDDGDVCIISTGSQGEPMAALARMSTGDNKFLQIKDGDCVILSSHPIPGNEHSVNAVIEGLLRRGAEVVDSTTHRVHATGHAKSEELKVMHSIVKPEWFIPVHGEYRHLVEHARLATRVGTPPERVVVCSDGDSVVLSDKGLKRGESVPAEYVYVHGTVGDLGEGVLDERRTLGTGGLVSAIVSLRIEGPHASLVGIPEIVSRGWVSGDEGDQIHKDAVRSVTDAVEDALAKGVRTRSDLEKLVRRTLGRFVSNRTRLRPAIVPVVLGAHE